MVATRNHPTEFPSPPSETPTRSSPTKRSTRSSAEPNHVTTTTAAAAQPTPSKPVSISQLARSPLPPRTSTPYIPRTRQPKAWSHTPSNLTLIWLAISLPLVIWDTGYVFLRPYSMPGGSLQWPLWVPYELYGQVDHIYGSKAWDAHNGFTAAQATLNTFETAAYLVYLYWVYAYGQQEKVQGRGAPDMSTLGRLQALGESRTVHGRVAGWAVLLAFSTASLTFSKTVLYWLNEAFSGFDNIGHNDVISLIFLWIIPNGAWIVFPIYMMYVFGGELLEALETAAGGDKKAR
ncbi:hypothetical protein LTR78_010454 [Recurvomyces mirabilis]|uniref:C6 transcription factor n=1 Tax=Recurvomyces mirabilis TaxID=574656 RepID=A0AAE0TPS6_9PEZI|nr:hypothetical protein LTR78_010454 [Recurvomyces mirabilis]KAK5150532.1 hypothetical protein LTS14_010026 [Recurvomyces mirabilis]